MKYSPEIKELVVQKRLSGSRSVKELSDEFGISTWTIRKWLRDYQENGTMAGKEKRPRDWTAPERVEALIETSRLQEKERGSWCRSRGLHSHHLNSWKRDAIAGCSNPVAASRTKADRLLEKENKNLKRELNRKEKALAEVAALLVLKKKVDSLWREGEDG